MSEPSDSTPVLKFWHGSQRWDGHPQVGPSKKGRYEAGPGIYLTTHRNRAAGYAKGAGSLVYVEASIELRLLEDARLTRQQMAEALAALPRLRNRKKIEADLDECAERHPDGRLFASYLVNLIVNHEALTGGAGPALARWLTEHGIDASRQSQSGNEDWLVVFNPDVLKTFKKLTAAQADAMGLDAWDWGSMEEQRAALAPSPAVASPSPRSRRSP